MVIASRRRAFAGCLPVLLLLSGCIGMPHPFADPGKEALALALSPPPSRLSVPTPSQSLLDDASARAWAGAVSSALLDQSVPAIAQPARAGDWWLRMRAVVEGDMVVPTYSVMMPTGSVRGTFTGHAVAARQWSQADHAMLQTAAQEAAPGITSVLTGIQADGMDKDRNSLKHRPARVFFKGVTGAPGDGNISLARAFVGSFQDRQNVVQSVPKGADFTVACTVTLTDGPPGTTGHPQQHIEIVWHVADAAGKEAGAATQLHDIDAHSLDHAWSDVAEAVAQEAADAAHQIVSRYSGRDNVPLPSPSQANNR